MPARFSSQVGAAARFCAQSVVCSGVDEKSAIQALDRAQPGLPMAPGRCGALTHDDQRNGASTLFAALNTLTGAVIGQCHKRRRGQAFLSFIKAVNKQTLADKALH